MMTPENDCSNHFRLGIQFCFGQPFLKRLGCNFRTSHRICFKFSGGPARRGGIKCVIGALVKVPPRTVTVTLSGT